MHISIFVCHEYVTLEKKKATVKYQTLRHHRWSGPFHVVQIGPMNYYRYFIQKVNRGP